MDQLNIDHTVLVGQSLGGGIAMTFAVEHPDRVSQLGLVDAAGLPNPEPISARMFMLPGVGEFLLRLPVDAIRRRMLNDFFLFDPAVITPEQFQLLFWSHKIAGSIASALSIMALFSYPAKAWINPEPARLLNPAQVVTMLRSF